MIYSLIQKARYVALDIFFPPLCVQCSTHLDSKEREILCRTCLNTINIHNASFCGVCRARLPDNQRICHFNSPFILAAAGSYSDPVLQNLIHIFKYKGFKNAGPVLGALTAKYLRRIHINLEGYSAVSIPLHTRRERERGFNQAQVLASIVANEFGLELNDVLIRTKNNKPQAHIKDSDLRRKNIEGSFELRSGADIKGKNVLLVDDVFTSGATMNEAVLVLKHAGAKNIIALVAARA